MKVTKDVILNFDVDPSPGQPRIEVTNIESLEWEQVAWSREVWIADYETSTGRPVVGWTFLSVICRTTDKNVHPTPIRRSCSRWSTPRCGSRWNWPSRYRRVGRHEPVQPPVGVDRHPGWAVR
jgi:hypothetical protein